MYKPNNIHLAIYRTIADHTRAIQVQQRNSSKEFYSKLYKIMAYMIPSASVLFMALVDSF